MADKQVRVIVEAVDNASGVLDKISSQIEQLAGGSTIGKAVKGIELLGKGLDTVKSGYEKISKFTGLDYGKGLRQIGNVAGMAINGLSAVTNGFVGVVEASTGADLSFQGLMASAVNYEQIMKQVGAITGANSDEFARLTQVAEELGAKSIFTQEEIAEGMQWMGQNGQKAEAIIRNMEAVTNLATVGNLDLADSARIVSSAMNQFQLNAGDATRVVDAMNRVALTSGATIESYGKTLEYVGGVAHNLNIPIEEVGVAVGILGKNAIVGSRAGTSLRAVLNRLTTGTGQAGKAIKQYGLETAVAQIKSGHLTEGLMMMADKFDTLSDSQKQNLAYMLAGSTGMNALLAIMNQGRDGIKRYNDELNNTASCEKTAEEYMKTLQGQMNIFANNCLRMAIALKNGLEQPLTSIMTTFNNFTDQVLNNGLTAGFQYLAQESQKWGVAIEKGITSAIGNIKNFVSGGGLDSILEIGTNIITGICNGITNNQDDIRTIFSDIIGKLAGWVRDNAPQITEAVDTLLTCFSDAIHLNSDTISQAGGEVLKLLNTSLLDQREILMSGAMALGAPICEGLLAGAIIGIPTAVGSIIGVVISTAVGFLNDFVEVGKGWAESICSGFLGAETWAQVKSDLQETLDWAQQKVDELYEKMGIVRDGGQFTENKAEGSGKMPLDDIGDGAEKNADRVETSTQDMSNSIATNLEQKLANLDKTGLEQLGAEFENLGSTITRIAITTGGNFERIANSARTNFLSVANIVRSQMVNVSNICKNQMKNARDGFTEQALSMAKVARTQMVNISNIMRNQAVAWSNIIRNQASNARDALTSSFISMRKVTETQMAHVLRIVNQYMAQVATACNKSFTINVAVNKTITTTLKVNVEAGAPTSLNPAIPVANSLNSSAIMTAGGNSSIGLGTLMGAITGASQSGQVVNIEVPLYLEGREIARASAKYMDGELKRVNNRTDRKRGVK